jgi:MFS family permease
MAVAALASSTAIVLAGFALAGIGLANLVPILFSVAGRHGGANPGAAIAAVSFIGYGGMLLAPTVIGVTAEQVGFPAVFVALSGLLLIVAALAPAVATAPTYAVQAGSETGQA